MTYKPHYLATLAALDCCRHNRAVALRRWLNMPSLTDVYSRIIADQSARRVVRGWQY